MSYVLCSIPLTYIRVFVSVLCCVSYYSSALQLELHSNLFVQDYLGNPWSSVSTYKFYFFSFVKNAVGILIEIALNL